jgi:alpha-tubulin suppressor-like RCC1 family protein
LNTYIHYPYRQPKVIGFGDRDNSKLAMEANNDPTKTPEIVPDLFENLKYLVAHKSFVVALDENGVFYEAGQKDQFSQVYPKFTKITVKNFKEDEDKFVKLVAGIENVILLSKKGKIYIEGKNEAYQIDDLADRFEMVEKKIPNDDDPVVDVAAGRNFHLIVTKSGKLYGAGNYFLKDIKLE